MLCGRAPHHYMRGPGPKWYAKYQGRTGPLAENPTVVCGGRTVAARLRPVRSERMTIDWSDPAARNRLIESVDPEEYDRL